VRATPDGLEESSVIAALRQGWNFGVDAAEYAAVGAGSYHWQVTDEAGVRAFVTVDDLGQKAWLGDTHDAALDGLRRAFDTSVALRDCGLPFVVAPIPTHASAGRFLVDWDTVALAPPERDLWMVIDGGDAANIYTRATGTQPNDAALDFFRLTWDLKDFAEYLSVLRAPHTENADTVRQCGSLSNCVAIRETWAAFLD
jgi:hypothetical protein